MARASVLALLCMHSWYIMPLTRYVFSCFVRLICQDTPCLPWYVFLRTLWGAQAGRCDGKGPSPPYTRTLWLHMTGVGLRVGEAFHAHTVRTYSGSGAIDGRGLLRAEEGRGVWSMGKMG